jgi:hypothetical protein
MKSLFLLVFLRCVTDVTDVTSTFAFGGYAFEIPVERPQPCVDDSKQCRFGGETSA